MTSPTLLSESVSDAAASTTGEASAPQRIKPRVVIPAILFLVTLVSTTSVGMRYMYNFRLGKPPLSSEADILPFEWVLHHLDKFSTGLPFSITLIAILLAHEFGHYFSCRAHGVRATLPYLLPAPSLSGSFGAVIALQSRVKTRAALITIGALGPIAGFLVAIVTVSIGLHLSHSTGSQIGLTDHVQVPLLFRLLQVFRGPQGGLDRLVPHPVLVASWMGLLITALNLIPAGQLDGGHILYSVSPAAYRISHRLVIVCLLVLGVFCWSGWLVWGLILLMPAMKHPVVPDDGTLKVYHLLLFPACVAILVLSAMYAPFQGFSILDIVTKLPRHW